MVGHPPPSAVTEEFKAAFSEGHLKKKYPILQSGYKEGITHWIFQSYYVELGNNLGYQAIVEYPFFSKRYRETIGFDGGMKRSDVSWLNKSSKITCTIEFEDFSTNPHQKARNLIRYSEEQDDLELIILHYWTTKSRSNSRTVKKIKEKLHNGFDYTKPQADAMLIETVFSKGTEKGHTLTHIVETFPHSN